MSRSTKTGQLQVRVSEDQKQAIQRAAARAGLDMSSYVLSRVLPAVAERFGELLRAIRTNERFALAELNSFLSSLTTGELRETVASDPGVRLSDYGANYVAAMVELVCAQRQVAVPDWVRAIAPLKQPVFGSELQSIRLHLLMHSPAPFRRRNLFVDASVGDQV
jgi:uncharacterized protein (DUF1778 family)